MIDMPIAVNGYLPAVDSCQIEGLLIFSLMTAVERCGGGAGMGTP